jgi:hypothetical protein
MIEILIICELGAAKRNKEKGPENANFSRFLSSGWIFGRVFLWYFLLPPKRKYKKKKDMYKG